MNNFSVNQGHKNTPKSKLTLKQYHELIIVSGPVRNVSVQAGQLDAVFCLQQAPHANRQS